MRKPLLIVGCIFMAVLTYSFFVRAKVDSHAKQIAAGQPYCIMVPAGNGYKIADNYFDTMGFLMRGNSSQNHAILVVGYKENQAVYHWSYFGNGFVDDAYGPWGHSCAKYKFNYDDLKPADFLEKITIFANDNKYVAPLVYQPTVTSDSGIGLVAKLPNFKPVKERCSERTCNMIHATKNKGTPLRFTKNSSKDEAMYLSLRSFGLETGPYISNGLPRTTSGLPYGTYYARNRDGEISTVIYCLGASDVQCSFEFDRSGMRYSFHVMPEDLNQWKTLEDQIVKFVESFVEQPNPSLRDFPSTGF